MATNTQFLHAEHKSFTELISKLRPSYKPPTRKPLAGDLLDKVYEDCKEQAQQQLSGKFVTMSLDGWSNIHNDPIVCTVATTTSG